MGHELLAQLVLAYGAGVFVVLLLRPARLPSVVGFLLAGVLIGPHGLGWVRDPVAIRTLADIGVVILLFTIGVELSLRRVLAMGMSLLVAGLLQMGLATAGVALPLRAGGSAWALSLVVGLLAAPSSTTLLLRILGERGEMEAPQGRLALGIGIVQDLCVVPVMILLPLLGGARESLGEAAWTLAQAGLVIVGTVALARIVVPRIFEIVVDTRSRELFALTVIFLCLATAYGASVAGLSLALGAFLGGLVVSESPYSHQVLGEMQPIRDGLAGLFFIGVGMLLDVAWVVHHPALVLALVVGILLFKVLTTGAAVLLAGYGLRTAFLTGMALAQIGEFSFVVAQEASRLELLGGEGLALFLAVAVLTMVASPLLYRGAPRWADALDRWGGARWRGRHGVAGTATRALTQHVIVVGYGLTGHNVASALVDHGVPFVALEMNPETVRRERAAGVPILFGDAGHAEVLEQAGLAGARVLVVAIGDAPGSLRVVSTARAQRPDLHIVVRTRYLREVEALRATGANEVVPDEVETSVEIFARVLRAYDLPSDAIERSVRAVRADTFAAIRGAGAREGLEGARARMLSHVDLEFQVVGPGAPAAGATIQDLEVRKRYGVTVLAVRRAGALLPEPGASTRLEAGDLVVVMGTPDLLAGAAHLFRSATPAAEPPPRTEEAP